MIPAAKKIQAQAVCTAHSTAVICSNNTLVCDHCRIMQHDEVIITSYCGFYSTPHFDSRRKCVHLLFPQALFLFIPKKVVSF